ESRNPKTEARNPKEIRKEEIDRRKEGTERRLSRARMPALPVGLPCPALVLVKLGLRYAGIAPDEIEFVWNPVRMACSYCKKGEAVYGSSILKRPGFVGTR